MLATRIAAVLLGAVMGVTIFLWALRLPARGRLVAFTATAAAMSALPLFIPVELAWVRFVALVPIAATVFKLFDLHASAHAIPPGDHPDPRDPRQAIAFILAPPSLLTFRRWRRRRPLHARPKPGALIPHLALALASGAALYGVFRIDWATLPFALEYVAKVSLVFVLVPALANAIVTLDRMRGVPGRPMFDRVWTSPTPAEFWRRFDTPFHHFCLDHLFFKWGGARHPRLATLAIFAFSAAGHEALFSIAIGRVEGHQLAFFMLNGLVVAATLGMRPRTPTQRALSTAATIAFILGSGTLFFASVQSLMPFFDQR